ncbi:hypothetical protein LY78DRAFT_728009 [Colletotrichum sublineola]|nr:hypothetical protein LY78DRAFT_728009 [Colletotrichum sublineola]
MPGQSTKARGYYKKQFCPAEHCATHRTSLSRNETHFGSVPAAVTIPSSWMRDPCDAFARQLLFQEMSTTRAYLQWRQILQLFMEHFISYDEDRLPALSHMSTQFGLLYEGANGRKDRYHVGAMGGRPRNAADVDIGRRLLAQPWDSVRATQKVHGERPARVGRQWRDRSCSTRCRISSRTLS